jgi:hypothetical protein
MASAVNLGVSMAVAPWTVSDALWKWHVVDEVSLGELHAAGRYQPVANTFPARMNMALALSAPGTYPVSPSATMRTDGA